MHRGFKLALDTEACIFNDHFSMYADRGYDLFASNHTKMKYALDHFQMSDFILSDGSVDGSKLQAYWFPRIKADVFISHSHQDEKLALALSGWLYDTFRLVPFVDSCAWGYFDKLSELLFKGAVQANDPPQDHKDAENKIRDHVHTMLIDAITEMIDITDCLFFLNTSNSIHADGKTQSNWIQSELKIAKSIRKRPREEKQPLLEFERRGAVGFITFSYKAPVDHLTEIDSYSLMKWSTCSSKSNDPYTALGYLYDLNP